MDFNSLLSTEVLKKLRCSKCQNYLSYFPIYITTDKLNICGRCSNLKEENYIQNEVYEAICEKVAFPCRFASEGCAEEILPKQMPAHEDRCNFRTVKCPTAEFSQCDWQGSHPNLLQHCCDKHSDIILEDGKFEFEFSKSQKWENLLIYEEAQLVIFIGDFDSTSKVFNYMVHHLQDEVDVSLKFYKITFDHEGRSFSLKEYLYQFEEKSGVAVSLDMLKDPHKHNDVVHGTIDLKNTSEESMPVFFRMVNEELLSQLQCSVCHEYLMPPLDLHAENQTKCSQCRAKLSSREYTKMTNIKLDEIANLLHYPCKYKKNGCTFVLQPPLMKIHQKDCPYEIQVCPLSDFVNCKWSGLNKDVVYHVEKEHFKLISNTNVISERLSFETIKYSEITRVYLIKSKNCFLRLIFWFQDERFCWAVHNIGTRSHQNRFKYEIEVVDRTLANRKLLMRQVCPQMLTNKKNEIFRNVEEYCYLQRDQIDSLIFQDLITFKVQIVK